MLIYEVNLTVQPDAAAAFSEWLPGHVEEVIALPGFLGATWFEDAEEAGPERRWVVQYRLADERSLERYFTEHAGRMRRDGIERFGGRFSATRRVLGPLQDFISSEGTSAAG